MNQRRREFLKEIIGGSINISAAGLMPSLISSCTGKREQNGVLNANQNISTELFFKISLAEWSLNHSIFSGELTNLEFPAKAKNDFGINAVEYVNQFFKDKAEDLDYLRELKRRADDHGVANLLIMVDNEGDLGTPVEKDRIEAVENHYKWIDAAKLIGCHSIRVNTRGNGTEQEVKMAAIDGLGRLCEYGAQRNISVIVENHGGYSSIGTWLSQVIIQVNSPYCGTLPDFNNFCIKSNETDHASCVKEYDRYQGMQELMPYARGVSAKAFDFDDSGNEVNIDFSRIMTIVKNAGYSGFVGIEYEGKGLSEFDGIMATKALLEKVGAELS